ncbi:MAG TPA: enoyl-CoA hydratase-related protein, partial [Thermoleophilaceae bacterium]|nr:enoyl-CoA hydratase-related protein [Thermoleophilaceae bacterium]
MPLVKTEREGRTILVRLDNPPRNFMNAQMVDELDDLTRELEADRSVGAVVITGAMEGTFITHFDVGELVAAGEAVGQSVSPGVASGALRVAGVAARLPGAPAAMARTQAAGLLELRQIHDVFMRMNRMDKVFVA